METSLPREDAMTEYCECAQLNIMKGNWTVCACSAERTHRITTLTTGQQAWAEMMETQTLQPVTVLPQMLGAVQREQVEVVWPLTERLMVQLSQLAEAGYRTIYLPPYSLTELSDLLSLIFHAWVCLCHQDTTFLCWHLCQRKVLSHSNLALYLELFWFGTLKTEMAQTVAVLVLFCVIFYVCFWICYFSCLLVVFLGFSILNFLFVLLCFSCHCVQFSA